MGIIQIPVKPHIKKFLEYHLGNVVKYPDIKKDKEDKTVYTAFQLAIKEILTKKEQADYKNQKLKQYNHVIVVNFDRSEQKLFLKLNNNLSNIGIIRFNKYIDETLLNIFADDIYRLRITKYQTLMRAKTINSVQTDYAFLEYLNSLSDDDEYIMMLLFLTKSRHRTTVKEVYEIMCLMYELSESEYSYQRFQKKIIRSSPITKRLKLYDKEKRKEIEEKMKEFQILK